MVKDIEWLHDKLHDERIKLTRSYAEGREYGDQIKYNDGKDEAFGEVLDMIKELDSDLPVVPYAVAEWFKENKGGLSIFGLLDRFNRDYLEDDVLKDWVDSNKTEMEVGTSGSQEIIARMYLDGYNVEEVKYEVRGNDGNLLIYKNNDTIKETSPYHTGRFAFELTEKEIRDFDPRYIAFAVPVEEID